MSPHCDLEDSKPISLLVALDFLMMHHGTKFDYKRFRRYCLGKHKKKTKKLLLWPWSWTQQSSFFRRYMGLWWCTIKLSLLAKGSAVHNWNGRNSLILITWAITLTLKIANHDLEDSKPLFSQDNLVHDGAPPYQVWLQKKLSGSEVTIQTKLLQTDKWLQYPHLSFITRGMYMVNQNTVKCSKQKYSSFWQHTLKQICKLIQVHQDIRTCPILNLWSKVTNKKKKCRRFFYHQKIQHAHAPLSHRCIPLL